MDNFCNAFSSNHITGEILLTLDRQTLMQKFEMTAPHVDVLVSAINKLRQQ
jgi:hypothetical protein